MQALKIAEGTGHNTTASYFWLQMVTYHSATSGEATSFSEFIGRQECKKLVDPRTIDMHYTSAVLSGGAVEFALPDKKALPSLVR